MCHRLVWVRCEREGEESKYERKALARRLKPVGERGAPRSGKAASADRDREPPKRERERENLEDMLPVGCWHPIRVSRRQQVQNTTPCDPPVTSGWEERDRLPGFFYFLSFVLGSHWDIWVPQLGESLLDLICADGRASFTGSGASMMGVFLAVVM